MSPFSFISSLLPSFKKHGILEDCSVTGAELRETTIPAYEIAAPLFKGRKFKSKQLIADSNTFEQLVTKAGRENMVYVINDRFKNILGNLESTEKMITATFNPDVAGEGLTYMKANLLQFVEAIAFVSKYSRKYLSYVYVMETSEYEGSDTRITETEMSPVEVQWLRSNFVSFCSALNIVSGEPHSIKNKLADVPEIVVTSENAETLKETLGSEKIDPFNMGIIPVWMNPVYHIGMMVAEWQAKRYKAAEEELKLLQSRHLYLERVQEGKNDAGIKKQIEVLESRIGDLNYKIGKMESK